MADRFVATEPGPLLPLLAAHFPTWSKNTLRQRLQLGCIDVNGKAASRHDQLLAAGDTVEIRGKGEARVVRTSGPRLPVLHEDDDLLAVDKPAGLLSVASDDESERTALAIARQQVGRPGQPAALWPAHRLDRETSGVLLFAKSRVACDRVQAGWGEVRKVYLAVVEGVPVPPAGTIDLPLREDRTLHVRAGAHPDARPARSHYTTIETARGRALLEVAIDTGRKHQIRVHLSAIGHPVVGDARYGTRGRHLCLHALRLELPHPHTGAPITVEAPAPAVLRTELRRG
jgi:23S rRNA pseudouridine1911/1915/1917 synthase